MQMRSILTGILAAQVVLAGSLFIHNQNQRGGADAVPLLAFPSSDVDRIVVTDGSGSTTLQREGESWQLSELSGLPASKGRVNTLLDNLSKLKTQWPVARSTAGRERFEVSEDKFQRHLSLYQGDELLGDYYFGTSPGFRQTHARRADDDEVYALAFNNFDLPVDDNDWLQKDLLQVDGITAIKGADFELVKNGEDWQLSPQPAVTEMELDADKVKTMVTTLQRLNVLRVAESVPAGESHVLSVTTADGTHDYVFTKEDSRYFVKRSDRDQAFTMNNSDYDKLHVVARAELLKALPAPGAAPAEASAETEIHAGSASLPATTH